jgi:hypothetical protein
LKKQNAANPEVRGAGQTSRETISPRHVADPSLTDKDGKQDAKEDDEKSELHVHSLDDGGVSADVLVRRVWRLRHSGETVKVASE